MSKHHRQNSLDQKAANTPSFSPLDFVAKSTLLSVALTFLPITLLVALWQFKLTTPAVMIIWVMFALFWTFYVLLKLSHRLVD